MLTDQARVLLHEWVQSESLRKHCEAVAACMGYFARQQGANEDLWTAVALLHDMDFERFPEMPSGPHLGTLAQRVIDGDIPAELPGHPFQGVAYLRRNGWSAEVCRAIFSHADYSGISRETPLERTLYAVDELSGFVTAVALVRPSKSIHEVDVRAVRKKMKDKAFAAKVNRDDIVRGAEEIGMPLDDLIGAVIAALTAEAKGLGIDGVR